MTAPDDSAQLRFRTSTVLKTYSIVVAIGVLGTYLAYNGLLSSQAWQAWSGRTAWIRDSIRLLLSALAALFFLWNMDMLGSESARVPPDAKRRELLVVLAGTLVTIWLTVGVFPASFQDGLRQRSISFTARDIWIPYIPYALYNLGFWIGIVMSLFVAFTRRFVADARWWRSSGQQLSAIARSSDTTADGLLRLRRTFQEHVACLKTIAERYVPLILGVALLLIFEQVTSSHRTLTQTAIDVAKVASWLLLVPALGLFIVTVAFGYQNSIDTLDSALPRFFTQDQSLTSEALDLQKDLVWEHSPLEFIASVVKSASVSIPALAALIAWAFEALKSGGWLAVFLPQPVLGFFQRIYG
jgi:hypothetical protein